MLEKLKIKSYKRTNNEYKHLPLPGNIYVSLMSENEEPKKKIPQASYNQGLYLSYQYDLAKRKHKSVILIYPDLSDEDTNAVLVQELTRHCIIQIITRFFGSNTLPKTLQGKMMLDFASQIACSDCDEFGRLSCWKHPQSSIDIAKMILESNEDDEEMLLCYPVIELELDNCCDKLAHYKFADLENW